jgi:hypothetical protein
MNTKTVYTSFVTVGGLCLLVAGYWTWQANARAQLQHTLMDQARPLLNQMKEKEIEELVQPARDQIRTEFHALAFKVSDFVDEICSDSFARKLAACHSREDQQKLLLLTFKEKVTTDAGVLEKMRELSDNAAQVLDDDWAASCKELTERWNLTVKPYGGTLTGEQLVERMQPTVTAGLRRTATQAERPARKGRLGASLNGIAGRAMVLPSEEQGVYKGMPVFAARNFNTTFDSVIGHVQNRRGDIKELKRTISSKLSDLGNLLAHDFREEIRSRIEELHEAQEKAVEEAASQQASELIHIL